jgi:hypothetical protein
MPVSYNPNNWMASLQHVFSATNMISGLTYSYDNEGNKLSETNQQYPSLSESFAYDADYRLTNYAVPSPTIQES